MCGAIDVNLVRGDNLTLHDKFDIFFQWFGNLVTMKWWNDLWLNEGFASYVEWIGTDASEPNWNNVS